MRKLITLPHYHTSGEIAALLTIDSAVINRLIRASIHPPWTWKPRWKEPRWDSSTISDWLNILNSVDLNSLPKNPPPLERPEETFRESRRGPTAKELVVSAKACGIK